MALVLVTWTAVAARAEPANYRFRRPLADEHELVSVIDLAQDARGAVWFIQKRTLRSYDGTTLEIVARLDGGEFTALAGDQLGNLWLGTKASGLRLWDHQTETLSPWSDPLERSSLLGGIVSIDIDARGQVWALSESSALARISPETQRARIFQPEDLEGDRGKIEITALAIGSEAHVWLGTKGGELLSYRADEDNFERRQLLDNTAGISALTEGIGGRLWVATSDGRLFAVDQLSLAELTVIDRPPVRGGQPAAAVTALVTDPEGHLWIGSEDGLQVLTPGGSRPETITTDPETQQLEAAPIRALYLDQSGVIWVADTYGEVSTTSTRASAFDLWRVETERANVPVTSIATGADGSVWVGTHEGGVSRRLPSGRFVQYDQIGEHPEGSRPTALSLLADDRGHLWVGTLNNGLTMIDIDSGTSTRYRADSVDDPTALSNPSVTALFERSDGNLWLGTYNGGLNLLDLETQSFTVLRHDPENAASLSENQVRSILEDSAGRLWVGSRSTGLNLRLPGSNDFQHFRHDPGDATSIASDTIVAISEDRHEQIWLGTYQGLEKIVITDGRVTFEHYGERQGLAGRRVFSVIEDKAGYLWLSTSQGISRFHRETGRFINLARNHGLPPGGYSFNAYAHGPGGTLYYGNSYGVTEFHPDEISLQPYAPQIVLTAVKRLNRPIELPKVGASKGELTFAHSDSLISFEFSLLDFVAPSENRYEHYLEGYDEEWINLGNHQRVNYSNLPPGRYTFKVRGVNSEGIWSQDMVLAFRVLPPIWATWWAYAFYLALAFSAIFLYARHQARKQRREALYTQRLERDVHRRTRELAAQNEKLRYANELLEVASVTDSLTGVRNRRFLLTTIDQDIALVDRSLSGEISASGQDSAFVFILFDLDGFKEINDTYGHSAGDLVLFQVRDLLNKACRTSDTLIRWGGDEFLIVAREATRAHVEALAERIRQSVAEHLFDINAAQPVQLTCSLGFACYPFVTSNPRLYSWEEVIDIADRALYVAKRHGPNMWAGIFGTEQTEETPAEDLLVMIMERPELLGAEGSIRLVTSRPTPAQVKLHTSASGR